MKASLTKKTNILATLLDLVSAWVLWIDENGHIQDANESVCNGLGYTKKEIASLTLFEISPHLSLVEWKKQWEKLKDFPSAPTSSKFMTRNQQFTTVRWQALKSHFTDSERCCFVAVPPNQHALEQEELEKLHLSQFTLDISKDIVLWVRPDASIEYINKGIRTLLGYTPEEAVDMLIYDIDPFYNKENFQKVWENLKKEQHEVFETQLRHKNGRLIPVEVRSNYLEYAGEGYNCAFIRDIREQKRKTAELEKAMEKIQHLTKQLEIENTTLKEEIAEQFNFNNIITSNKRYQQILQRLGQVAQTQATVLIVGETGTGKELMARAIHQKSKRFDKPMIKVNCAALPKDLVESELFGHEKGAFTGAYQQKKGRFELADGGTLFLDEIGELPLSLQPKLLRVLQDGIFERVGGSKSLKVNVRIIAATNRQLDKMVNRGNFREDLYYRLNVFPIESPPLRERKEDIPLLVNYFVKKYNKRMGKRIEEVPASSLRRLSKYEFPGNVRELENIVERAVILSPGKVLNLEASMTGRKKPERKKNGAFPSLEEIQRQHIIKALERTGWRISGPKGAGRLLKMNDRTLMSRMRRLGIRKEDHV